MGFGNCKSCVKTFKGGEGVCKCSVLENFGLVCNKRDRSSLILNCACFCWEGCMLFWKSLISQQEPYGSSKASVQPTSMQTLDSVSFKLKLRVILLKRSSSFQRT